MKTYLIVASVMLAAAPAFAAAQSETRKPYIVQLSDAPVLRYEGGVAGMAATRPAAGSKLDVNAQAVQDYVEYLDDKQSNVLDAVPQVNATYRYKIAFNGFAAWLTDAELAKLAATPGVRRIDSDDMMRLDTASTPRYLGINQPGGVWSRNDANGRNIKGENVIIGHIDGGVWPENPSFSDKVGANGKPVPSHLPGTVVYNPLPAGQWAGICQPSTGASGVSFTASHCNNKLIGARFYNATWKQAVALGLTRTWSGEYLDSPRDPDGHGTHTLSTSGGNENVDVTVSGSPFTISGIAPRARVAAYKTCYTPADANDVPGLGGCYPSDSVAAINQAVADGVDVLNFSIAGSRTSFSDPVEVAFANASFAGVFVAASAGNSNIFPGNASTVAHISPWVTTVGNSTHDRFTVATATLGNGVNATGPSFQTQGVPSKPLILAMDAGVQPFASLNNADKVALARCYTAGDRAGLGGSANAALDPAKVAGKIVVCIRGGNALVNKAQEVADNGGAAMILQNIPAGLLPAPLNAASGATVFNIAFAVPAVHLLAADAAAVIGHAGTPGATASIAPSVLSPVINPVMSDTSSRGPNVRDLNVLKPDITAPGTDIIAAYTNTSITPAQRDQIIAGTLVPEPGADMISGTSMSGPHVAGAAALLRQARPTWSPYAIKSAIMTSGLQNVKLANGAVDPNRFGYGAGHLNPNVALSTQVVYDQSVFDHIDYFNGAINGRQLNLASLTHANVIGIGVLSRTLTNKGSAPVTYNAAANLPGYDVTVEPATVTIPAGGSASFTVTMRRTTAAFEQWVFGSLVWSNGGVTPDLRSPLSAKASEIVALAQVTDTRNVGTKVFTIATGYNGILSLTDTGLTPANVVGGRVATNQLLCLPPLTLPDGVKTLRAQLFNSETEGGAQSDLDLVVFRGNTTVGSSAGADSNELVSLSNPIAGEYQACVDGFAPINGSASFKLNTWVLGPNDTGTLRAFGPRQVASGGVASVGVAWNVPANARYLGLVEYRGVVAGPVIGTTSVFIDNVASAAASTTSAPVLRNKE